MATRDGKERWLKSKNRSARAAAAAARARPRSDGGAKPRHCARTSKNARTRRAKKPVPATPATARADQTIAGIDDIRSLLTVPSALESAGSML